MLATACRRVNGKLRQKPFGLSEMTLKSSRVPGRKRHKFDENEFTVKTIPPPQYAPVRMLPPTVTTALSNEKIRRNLILEGYMLKKQHAEHYTAISALSTKPGGAYGRVRPLGAALSDLQPGDLIGFSDLNDTCGIILPPPPKNSEHYKFPRILGVLTPRGDIIQCKASDVTIVFPNFVSQEAVEAANDPQFHLRAKGQSGEEEEFNEKSFQHRAKLCKRLNIFCRLTESALQRLTPAFESLYLSEKAQDNLDVSFLTTSQIAKRLCDFKLPWEKNPSKDDEDEESAELVNEKEDEKVCIDYENRLVKQKGKVDRPLYYSDVVRSGMDPASFPKHLDANSGPVLYAAHQLLFRHPDLFLRDDLQHLATQTFAIRPSADLKALLTVMRWVQNTLHFSSVLNGKASTDPIRSFVEKAKRIINHRRTKAKQVSLDNPERRPRRIDMKQEESLRLSANDLTIVRSLRAGLGDRASEQGIFQSLVLYIGKLCDIDVEPQVHKNGQRGSLEEFRSAQIPQMIGVRLLQELGLLAPWENVANMSLKFHQTPVLEEKSSAGADAIRTDQDEERRAVFDPPVYVIDDVSALELDDGIAIEKSNKGMNHYHIHILVADPTTGLFAGDPLAEEAKRKHVSHYHPEGHWPMLPSSFSEKFGLRPAKQEGMKCAMRFSALIDIETGRVEDCDVGLVKLKNIRVRSYDYVDSVLSGEAASIKMSGEKEVEDLKLLHRAAIAMQKRRNSVGGAFVASGSHLDVSLRPLPLPPSPLWEANEEYCPPPAIFTGFPKISLLPRSFLDSGLGPRETLSRGIVSEAMVLSGRIAGSWAQSQNLPLLFRGQAGPMDDQEGARFLKLRDDNGLIQYQALLQSKVPSLSAVGSVEPVEHFAMGINTPQMLKAKGDKADVLSRGGYARVTSPLRRYGDLLNHWQIKHALRTGTGGNPFFSKEVLLEDLPRLNRMDTWARNNERSSTTFYTILKLQRGLQARKGEIDLEDTEERREVDAFLDDIHEALVILPEVRTTQALQGRVRVQLLQSGLRTELEWDVQKPGPKLGSIIRVKITDAFVSGSSSVLTAEQVK